MKILSFLACSLLLLSGCGGANKISAPSNAKKLHGTWQLNYITGPRIAFDGLYPGEKPTLTFESNGKNIYGNTSCNSFTGSFDAEGNKIGFKETLQHVKISCIGNGESVFIKTLDKINSYTVTEGYTLSLFVDGVASMRFTKVN